MALGREHFRTEATLLKRRKQAGTDSEHVANAETMFFRLQAQYRQFVRERFPVLGSFQG